MATSSKFVNLTHAKEFAQRIYSHTGEDSLVFLYTEDGQYDYIEEDEYRNGYGRTLLETQVYGEVFYGNGGEVDRLPTWDFNYYPSN